MRVFTQTDRDLAEGLFTLIARETAAAGGGVCRPSYGSGETTAWQIVAKVARTLGLMARADAAGNLVMTSNHIDLQSPAVWIGSHLDSVPRGGNYDGLAGVVAALLIVAKARELKIDHVPLVGVGLRGEESAWFGVPYIGAKAILGKLTEADLARRRRAFAGDDLTLATCMSVVGIVPERLAEMSYLLPRYAREFWELHIEQGPVLVERGKPVGVVTGIRGNVRAPHARIVGKAGHSGTVPHKLRDDAVVHFVDVMTKLESRRRGLVELGRDLVFTCGIVGTDPTRHSVTTIADEVRLALDVRSLDDRIARDFMAYAGSLGVDLGEVVTTPGATIATQIWGRAERACTDLGIVPEVMPSGAGHDAAVFQQAGIPSGMIFVRNEHGSHNPDEAMRIDDFMIGCEVLWRTVTS